MNQELFVKTDVELLALGLPSRALHLYGRLRLHAGRHGRAYPKHSTLAKELGLKSTRHVRRLLDLLQQFRLIEWTRTGGANEYKVLPPDRTFLSHRIGQKRPLSDRTKKSYIKDGHHQKKFLKDSPSPTPSPQGRETPPRTKPPRQPASPHPERPDGKTQAAKKTDDDEKTKPRPPVLSPEQEFRERLKERHGATFDTKRCIQVVNRQLEKCGLTLADFLAFDAERTTAPAVIANPNGYYTDLAKDLRKAAVSAARHSAHEPLRRAAETALPEPERDHRGLCKACGGPGLLADGAFCSCPIGRDLEKLGRRTSAKKGSAAATEPKGQKILTFPKKKGATT
jgi:hypothetical protein